MLMDRDRIIEWLGNPPVQGQGPGRVDSVVIDSRQVVKGSLFIPLAGERTDGHRFIEAALKMGAAVIPVASGWAEAHGEIMARWADRVLFPVVEDTLAALQRLAAGYLTQFAGLKVVGVTGSNGKTTTKELIHSILSLSGRAVCNEGNLNSDSGLPLSIFRIDENHRYATLEMGMNRKGEMAELARIARPDLALITNVGTAHIGMIGSRQGIAEEKKAVFSQFTGRETAFLNQDDPYLDFLARGVKGRIVTYGPGVTEEYEFVREEGIFGQCFKLAGRDVPFPLPGVFNVTNALGAAAVARELGFSWDDIAAGLARCPVRFGRGEVVRNDRIAIFRDCYNANGDSMAASLDLFGRTKWAGRKIIVLADMGELGGESDLIHGDVLSRAMGLEWDGLFLLGSAFSRAASALGGPAGRKVALFDDYEKLESALTDFADKGDLIMLKGSRVMALERLTEPLLAQ